MTSATSPDSLQQKSADEAAVQRYDRGIGTALRFWRFNLIGAIGIGVQFAVLTALVKLAHAPVAIATIIAVALAVAHNFLWHEIYTFEDRTPRGALKSVERFLRFNLTNGAISVVGNVVFTTLLVEQARMPLLAANAVSILICGTLNYMAADRLVFR